VGFRPVVGGCGRSGRGWQRTIEVSSCSGVGSAVGCGGCGSGCSAENCRCSSRASSSSSAVSAASETAGLGARAAAVLGPGCGASGWRSAAPAGNGVPALSRMRTNSDARSSMELGLHHSSKSVSMTSQPTSARRSCCPSAAVSSAMSAPVSGRTAPLGTSSQASTATVIARAAGLVAGAAGADLGSSQVVCCVLWSMKKGVPSSVARASQPGGSAPSI